MTNKEADYIAVLDCCASPKTDDRVKAVFKWLQRLKKKGPLYLVSHHIVRHNSLPLAEDNIYTIMYQNPKTKYVTVASVCDSMCIRYGIGTIARLRGASADDLWQSRSGTISQSILTSMLELYKTGESLLPVFDVYSLRKLSH